MSDMDVTPPDDDLKGVIMKFNNIESLSAALESAVSDLAKVREELVKTEESLEFSEGRRVMAELIADNWEARAKEAEKEVARLDDQREKDFDRLVWDYAAYIWEGMKAEAEGDEAKAAEMRGAAWATSSATTQIYMRSMKALKSVNHEPSHLIIEVWDYDRPSKYYYWDADGLHGKFSMVVEAK